MIMGSQGQDPYRAEREWFMEETEEVREPFVKVLTTHDDRRVVTVIEILSPVNKIGAGREQYRKKQLDMLEGDVHLLEIDLLRAGQHTVAAPPASILRRYGMAWDYVISLHRARTGNRKSRRRKHQQLFS